MKRSKLVSAMYAGLSLVGCGDGGAKSTKVPWAGQQADVVNLDGSVQTSGSLDADGCVAGKTGVCIPDAQQCEGDAVDVVLDTSGELLDVVCYPPSDVFSVEDVEAAQGDIAQNENNVAIVLDGADDGVDLEGDLDVDANNVVVYGQGPDVSIISGDVTVDGNNTIVRGVRVQGDVSVVKNDSVFFNCVIEGDLEISANNTQLIGCDVFGEVTITGNNTELHGTRLASSPHIDGSSTSCMESVLFDDMNDDLSVQETELGEALSCGK